jgi:outer membrane receptor for ferrienterochelin and colicins
LKQFFTLVYLIFSGIGTSSAQYILNCVVKDSLKQESLQGVTAEITGTNKISQSDENGRILLKGLAPGVYLLRLTHVGINEKQISVQVPQKDSSLVIYMTRAGEQMEEVIISSSRTNSRIEDLPTKVEVIGSEEMDEESSTIPGNISRLLGDVAGIQNQLTSATSGNTDFRVQGLPGGYTQILRDGLPLFGGYSGSFNILQIPPLDLKQAEIIKGSSSTLYGGGAIAGMINLISKIPQANKPERIVLANHSSLNESNLNAFFSRRGKRTGYTFFAGTTLQRAKDVNRDGFSDVPDLQSFFFHPRLFFYPDARNTLNLGYNAVYEDRKGGDMQVLHQKADGLHQFFIGNRSLRNTVDAGWEKKLNATDRLNARTTISFFNRDISTNVFGMKGRQRSFFNEFSYLKKTSRHVLVGGIIVSGEKFKKKQPDSSAIHNYNDVIAGVFLQDDWKISHSLTTQAGLRMDHNNNFPAMLLPRVSLLFKINRQFTTRIGGGLGYKVPTLFANEQDERDLQHITLSPDVKPERSQGINWDINYKLHINEATLTVNQMFFITRVNRPLVIDSSALPWFFVNATRPIQSSGTETYLQARYDELEIYLGYAYTNAMQLFNSKSPHVPLSALSKLYGKAIS